MKTKLLSAVVCVLGLVGCGGGTTPPPTNTDINTSKEKIETFLEGKTMVMEGANIPSHPNGYDEDVNYGSATQCYQSVTMKVAGGNYTVTSVLGTLRNAPSAGNRGECDKATKLTELSFTSTAALIENVKTDGSCFDVTYTYTGFKQSGRGKLSADGKTLSVELYFEGQATGHRCADGAVGAKTVTLNGKAFDGGAVQVYAIQ